jgi:hypothetical protein
MLCQPFFSNIYQRHKEKIVYEEKAENAKKKAKNM